MESKKEISAGVWDFDFHWEGARDGHLKLYNRGVERWVKYIQLEGSLVTNDILICSDRSKNHDATRNRNLSVCDNGRCSRSNGWSFVGNVCWRCVGCSSSLGNFPRKNYFDFG